MSSHNIGTDGNKYYLSILDIFLCFNLSLCMHLLFYCICICLLWKKWTSCKKKIPRKTKNDNSPFFDANLSQCTGVWSKWHIAKYNMSRLLFCTCHIGCCKFCYIYTYISNNWYYTLYWTNGIQMHIYVNWNYIDSVAIVLQLQLFTYVTRWQELI